MKIIKRNSSEEVFNGEKIVNAVTKANKACDRPYLTPEQIKDIAEYVEYKCMKMGRAGQDQLRADLRKAKETASRRKSEMGAALQAAQEKHDVEVTRVENRLLEEKNIRMLTLYGGRGQQGSDQAYSAPE